jgi:hypothetical protein
MFRIAVQVVCYLNHGCQSSGARRPRTLEDGYRLSLGDGREGVPACRHGNRCVARLPHWPRIPRFRTKARGPASIVGALPSTKECVRYLENIDRCFAVPHYRVGLMVRSDYVVLSGFLGRRAPAGTRRWAGPNRSRGKTAAASLRTHMRCDREGYSRPAEGLIGMTPRTSPELDEPLSSR